MPEQPPEPPDQPVIQPPNSFTVQHEQKPILYLPDGRVLVRRPIGFLTTGTTAMLNARTEREDGGK